MTKRILLLICLAVLFPIAALAQSYTVVLSGSSVVPGPGDTDGAGVAIITLDGNSVGYTVLAQGVTVPTAVEIRRGGTDAASGDLVASFNVNTLAYGSVDISQALADEIRANPGAFHVVVKNSEFANGALRGQLSLPFSAGSRVQYVPVVGKVTGAGGENFVTDLRLINYGATTASVTLDYFVASATGHSTPSASTTVTVASGEQKVLNDFLTTLPNASGIGGLRVTATENVEVRARLLNDLRASGEGTTGLAVEAGELSDAATSGSLGFLASSNDFRTNIGYFNPGPNPVNATFTAYSTTGAVLGTRSVTIPGWSMVQQGAFALINTVPAASQDLDDFYVRWTADGPLFVYAAVVDNTTGDFVVVE
jgi:hypothetical protein